MNPYIQQLKHEIREYEISSGKDTEFSVLHSLWQAYSDTDPVDDGPIRQCNDAIRPIFAALSLENADALSYLICDLCTAYQRAAFLDGIILGAHLAEELNSPAP